MVMIDTFNSDITPVTLRCGVLVRENRETLTTQNPSPQHPQTTEKILSKGKTGNRYTVAIQQVDAFGNTELISLIQPIRRLPHPVTRIKEKLVRRDQP